MKHHHYEPLNLPIHVYETPKEYADSEHKPFGDIPPQAWATYEGITNGKAVAFVVKKPNVLHIYYERDCSGKELFTIIAHELGHFQPKITVNLNEENKADRYEQFVEHVYNVVSIILYKN